MALLDAICNAHWENTIKFMSFWLVSIKPYIRALLMAQQSSLTERGRRRL